MKKIVYAIVIIIISFQTGSACDICGCSSGNYFLGPIPQFNKQFIGIRYSFRSFQTVLKSDASQFSKDFYQTSELWGGLKINKKFQVLVFIPYNYNHSRSDDGVKMNQGFGDITVMGSYKLFSNLTLTKDTQTVSQQFWIGGGIKLPSARFSVDTSEIVSSANNQAGTGSYDYIINSAYNIVWENWGITSNLSYKLNGSASGFKFGDRFTATAFTFRSFHLKKNNIDPNVGLLYENLKPNELNGTKITSTGGNALLAAVGLETRFTNVMIGCNAQLPVMQSISDSQTKIVLRGMLHITYTF